MTKQQQLQQELFNLKNQAREMLDKEGVTKEQFDEINNKIQIVKAKLKTLEEAIPEDEVNPQNRNGEKIVKVGGIEPKNTSARYEEALFNALKGTPTAEDAEILREARNSLGSESQADGGYLIPIDQQTQINELKREFTSLRDFVTVEPVSTLTGSRVLEKDAEHTSFNAIGENTTIGNTANPQFEPVEYKVKKYGGILPVPNELLADASAKLRGYLNKWLSKKSTATENTLIISILETFTKKAITGIDDIKDVLDKELDPAISSLSSVILNQDSFNYFNKLKDTQGNYILEKDPKNPTKKLLSGRPVIVLSNRILKTKVNKAPVIIGSLKEGVVLFDRQAISLLATNTGGESFINDRTDIRAIIRLDVKKFDTNAVVYGELDLSAGA
ncbi:phage major capsid protein [Cetobacterium somerae]|uniref:phage major capsid protein n=1 Tax=Cetobacterium somerae TaxID=188913 RepID=UPI0022509B44|nr:phage major capsid protein [Cetobacterium somerae]MCX3068431.1 phage major capsid protein [Cetobacterium somerae]